jgi:hypothetical protein
MFARTTRSQAKTLAAPIKATSKRNPLRQVTSREAALLEREAALLEREAALLEREAALMERESALIGKKEPKKSGKQFIINYVSEYRGMDAESEIFIGNDEKTTALAAFDWMVENRKGLDFELAWYALQDEGDNSFEDQDAIATHARKNCKSFKDLKKICNKYSDSYFESWDGWKLKFTKM